MSDKKLWASLCTVTPPSGPEIVQIYNGPLWETNATESPAFQHQLREAGIPETLKEKTFAIISQVLNTNVEGY